MRKPKVAEKRRFPEPPEKLLRVPTPGFDSSPPAGQ